MRISVLMLVLVVFALVPSGKAIITPDVTFIPPQISDGASFLALAEGDLQDSVRIVWSVQGLGDIYFGSFPKVGNNFVCYFSDTDSDANCGPTPFSFSTVGFDPYTMLVDSVNHLGETSNTTVGVSVGGIALNSIITVENKTVSMIIHPSGGLPSIVSYAVYTQENVSSYTMGFQPLTIDTQTGYWLGEIELPGGEYYIAFTANSGDNFGGDMARVSIPVTPLDECTDQPQGKHSLQAEEVVLSGVIISSNQHYEQTGFKITNLVNETFSGLEAVIPADLADILSIQLDDDELGSNDSTFFTVALDNIQSSMTVNALVDLISGTEVVGQISVNIPVTVIGGFTPSTGAFSIQPGVWSGDFLVGGSVSKVFVLVNNDESELTVIDYSVTGNLEDVASVYLPSSVPSSGKGSIDISLEPTSSGNYQGSVIIETSAGAQSILVNAGFYDDISSQLENLKSEFDEVKSLFDSGQLMLLLEVTSSIDTAISNAEDNFEFGNYRPAEKYFVEAQSQVSALSVFSSISVQPGKPDQEPLDLVTPLIAVIVLAGVVGAALFLKKKRGGKKMEEELDEELEEAMT